MRNIVQLKLKLVNGIYWVSGWKTKRTWNEYVIDTFSILVFKWFFGEAPMS